ncbi:MAG: glycosyl hydrolase-related protein [Candidatus Hydrogenedentes bacterium]|nr:glycosyl hydrolase-related protein [Candidatus Hydrogenedentota bacterium]
MTRSFLELKPDRLHVSAVKRSESGEGWIVRLFNPFDETIKGALRLNGGFGGSGPTQSPVERLQAECTLPARHGRKWRKVRLVTLEELPERDLHFGKDGWVHFEITKKKILSVEFLP